MSDFDDDLFEDTTSSGADDDPTAKKSKGRSARDEVDDDWDDDWDDESAAPKRDLTIVFAVLAAAAVIVIAVLLTRPSDDKDETGGGTNNAPATAQPTDALPDKTWQGGVGEDVGENGIGNIDTRSAAETGVFLWTGFDGWHVRNNTGQPVTVKIVAPAVGAAGQAREGAPGELTLEVPSDAAAKTDFDLYESESAQITVTAAGADLPADQIKLGGKTAVASSNPVIFEKR